MTWFTDIRLDYIDWRLLNEGAINRSHIVTRFDISENQASIDLNAFDREHPGAMRYDKSAKQYVPANGRYRPVRGARPGPMVIVIE